MKLIAETEEENQMLAGTSALMRDLGVDVSEYRTDEAYALMFWSADELTHVYTERYNLTREEAVYLLEETEMFLRMTMAAAGSKYLERALRSNLSRLRTNPDKT